MTYDPGQRVLRAIQKYCDPAASIFAKKLAALEHRFWSAVAGCDVPVNCRQIQRTAMLAHPTGVVIHPDVYVGERTKIFSGVVLGTRAANGAVPFVEKDCEIGTGAKILGAVHLRRGCKVGANAVVVGPKYVDESTHPVLFEEGSTIVGNPAKPEPKEIIHVVQCKICSKPHAVREGARPCGPNAWTTLS